MQSRKIRATLRGKTVLDVGCGTGILSMFAARAGAKKVIGIDMSEMALHAQQIVRENGLDSKVTIVRGKVENIKALPGVGTEGVDIIISEWMGYALLYECMFETVIAAREKWLRKDGQGIVLPNRARIFVEGLCAQEAWDRQVGYWTDVYGFQMNSVAPLARCDPDIYVVDEAHVVTDRAPVQSFDAITITPEDLDFKADFELQCAKDDVKKTITSICISFDCDFDCPQLSEKVRLKTTPDADPTHWKQAVLHLEKPIEIAALQGSRLSGSIKMCRNKRNPRELDIDLALIVGGDGKVQITTYHMQ